MNLLLLAGSGEAHKIAAGLAKMPDLNLTVSLAQTTRGRAEFAGPVINGGFGGDAGFREYLQKYDIDAVFDATHPFASRITDRTSRICAERGIPFCQFLRPAWTPESEDRWTMIRDETCAADHIEAGSTVFLATGKQTLQGFANLSTCRLICRQIDRIDGLFPFSNGEYLIGQPPFSVEDEIALFKQLKVDWLVVKNAGGEAPRSKLLAARALGIQVAMIDRPAMPDAPKVETIYAALDWVRGL